MNKMTQSNFIGSFTDVDCKLSDDKTVFTISSFSPKLENYFVELLGSEIYNFMLEDFIHFKITDDDRALTIEFNNKIYKVVQICNYRSKLVFNLHNVKMDTDFFHSLDSFNSFVDEGKKIVQSIAEMKQWEKDLGEISDGFFGVSYEDVREASTKLIYMLDNTSVLVLKELKRKYFNYSHSEIKDLSVVNGIKCFEWDPGRYSSESGAIFYRNVVRDFFINNFEQHSELSKIANIAFLM